MYNTFLLARCCVIALVHITSILIKKKKPDSSLSQYFTQCLTMGCTPTMIHLTNNAQRTGLMEITSCFVQTFLSTATSFSTLNRHTCSFKSTLRSVFMAAASLWLLLPANHWCAGEVSRSQEPRAPSRHQYSFPQAANTSLFQHNAPKHAPASLSVSYFFWTQCHLISMVWSVKLWSVLSRHWYCN